MPSGRCTRHAGTVRSAHGVDREALMWGEAPVGARGRRAPRFHLPAGTVTFLLSDIEGSTRLWSELPEAMGGAVADTYSDPRSGDRAARRGAAGGAGRGRQRGGGVLAGVGRGRGGARGPARAARAAWPGGLDLRVRIALHTADAQLRDEGNYFGLALSRCARLRAIAHGGQTLLSRATRDLVVDGLPGGRRAGRLRRASLARPGRPEHVFALVHPDVRRGSRRAALARRVPEQPARPADELRRARSRARRASRGARGDPAADAHRVRAGPARRAWRCSSRPTRWSSFADGAWWVDLAPVADPRLVGEVLARRWACGRCR